MNSAETEELIARHFDGTITPDEFALLQNRLKSEPAALALYMDHAANHALLAELYESSAPAAAPVRRVKPRVPLRIVRKKRAATPRWHRGVFAAAACIALAFFLWPARQTREVASLSFREESIWYYETGDGGRDSNNGGQLERDRTLHLVEGALRAVLPSGAVAVIESPAVLRLVGDNALRLDAGRGRFSVPPPAHGFAVITPERTITDLGTEFGVLELPGSGGTEVHVFKGRTVVSDDSSTQRELHAGQAVKCAADGEIRDIPVTPEAFSNALPVAAEVVFADDFESAGLADDNQTEEPPQGWTRVGPGGLGVFNPPDDHWYSGPDFSDTAPGGGAPGAMKGPSMAYLFNGAPGSGMAREIGKIAADSDYALTFAIGHRPLQGPRGEHARFGGYTVSLESGETVLATARSDEAPSPENSVGDAVLRWKSTAALAGAPLSIRITMNQRDYLDIDNVRLIRVPKSGR
ncbi:MAG: FecR domain-containing protein [Luteolibacter sp.]|uniref:FecR domain-containing protein n=1 Tax=Luteolibacter sp. TaxID=1962973 RepID=UPI003263359A